MYIRGRYEKPLRFFHWIIILKKIESGIPIFDAEIQTTAPCDTWGKKEHWKYVISSVFTASNKNEINV
jgi:hypothetical protein